MKKLLLAGTALAFVQCMIDIHPKEAYERAALLFENADQ
jgi:hypothetical protein